MIRREGHDPQQYTISRRGKKGGTGVQTIRTEKIGGHESPEYESSSPSEEEPPALSVSQPWHSIIVSSYDCTTPTFTTDIK